jgi:hypothetical protein
VREERFEAGEWRERESNRIEAVRTRRGRAAVRWRPGRDGSDLQLQGIYLSVLFGVGLFVRADFQGCPLPRKPTGGPGVLLGFVRACDLSPPKKLYF